MVSKTLDTLECYTKNNPWLFLLVATIFTLMFLFVGSFVLMGLQHIGIIHPHKPLIDVFIEQHFSYLLKYIH